MVIWYHGCIVRVTPKQYHYVDLFFKCLVYHRLMPVYHRLMSVYRRLMPVYRRLMPVYHRLMPLFSHNFSWKCCIIHVQKCIKWYGVLNVLWLIQFCYSITFFNQEKSFMGCSLAKPACYILASALLQIFLQTPLKIHSKASNRSDLPFTYYLSHWSKWKGREGNLGPYRVNKNEYFSEGIKYGVGLPVIYSNFFICRDLKFKTIHIVKGPRIAQSIWREATSCTAAVRFPAEVRWFSLLYSV
jgi:hypothetical protein